MTKDAKGNPIADSDGIYRDDQGRVIPKPVTPPQPKGSLLTFDNRLQQLKDGLARGTSVTDANLDELRKLAHK